MKARWLFLNYLAYMFFEYIFCVDYIFEIWYNNLLKYAKKEYFR